MTPAWMSGYAGDVAYTLGFYRELAPSFLDYVCTIVGVEGLPVGRRLRYCELGCGRGYGTTLLAAANPDIDFVGIDFNPAHIGEARSLAGEAGIGNVTFLEHSFGDAAISADPALADFDVVAAHGVFTWVSEAVRSDLIAFLGAKLVPGGLAYVSYNCLPGWSAVAPIQHVLAEFAERGTGNSFARLARGSAVLKELAAKSAGYVAQNPMVKGRIEALDKQDQAYLVHEYLDEHWQPIYVDQAFAALAEAKLTFVASATVAENRLPLCVAKDLVDFVKAMPDLRLHELLKDYAINKQFRRDVYVKGPRRLTSDEAGRRIRALSFVQVSRPEPLPKAWRIPAGEATIKPEIVEAFLARLDEGPASADDLIVAGRSAGSAEGGLATAIEILVHNGVMLPTGATGRDPSAAHRLNALILNAAFKDDTHRFLAAPACGSAIMATHFQRLAGQATGENPDGDDDAIVGVIIDRLASGGRSLRRDGKALAEDKEGIAEITRLTERFRAHTLGHWRRLGVVA